MKIEEVTEYMSSMYLERILRSYSQDYPKKGEVEYRKNIKSNVDTLSNLKSIKERIHNYFFDNRDPYSKQILYSFVLKSLLSKTEYFATAETIVNDVKEAEKGIINASKESDSFKHIEDQSITILASILDVGLEDDVITEDELALIVKLRQKLSLNKNDQYLIQAKQNLFPTKGNKVHTRKEISLVVDDLQKCGIIFCCNKHDEIRETVYVIPEEIVDGVKYVLDLELIKDKYSRLLNKLTNQSLKQVLASSNINQSGVKEDLINRIIQAGIKPSETLDTLSVIELGDLCESLPGLNKGGVKSEKINRIIDYFSNLIIKEVEDEENPGEKYYQYLEQLASRDLNNLLSNDIVTHPNDIERAFEEGTRFLFTEKLNHPLLDFKANNHADGGVIFNNKKSILLWDNKSRQDGNAYTFPDNHFRQFRRYIRNENAKNNRVNCFLVITAQIDPSAKINAIRLKAESGQDTDVALLTAENLKMVAEDWKNYSQEKCFNLQIFNETGILDREKLKERMKIFQSS